MKDGTTRRGSLEYLTEGYIIHWDERGLLVEVTDYGATPLLLVWKDVLALAKMAGHGPAAPPEPAPKPRPKRKNGRRPSPSAT